jgi:hypothetical protein
MSGENLMNMNILILGVCAGLLMTLSGCCCAAEDLAGGGYDGGYGGGDAYSDLFASEAGQYEGSDCWGSAGCSGVDDGTYQYEDYSSGSYDYYEQ